MEEIMVERYRAIRAELFNNDLDIVNDDMTQLITVKDIDSDLYTALLLLHSNYKAEQQAQRSRHIRITSKLIDAQIDALLLNKEKELREKEETSKQQQQPTGLITPKNIVIVLGSVGAFIFSMAVVFAKYPEQAKSAVDLLKLLLPGQGS
jgi:hypothetical protein